MEESADNPWANAAANRASAKTSLQLTPAESPASGNEEMEEVDPDSCGFVTLYQGMQIWHLIDILMGFLILLYGSIVSAATIAVVFIVGAGALLLIRGICGALALWTENICHRCGLSFSAGASPIMACTWFVLMFINLVVPGHLRHYLEQHHMLWRFLQKWESSHRWGFTFLLFALFLLECARWQLVLSLQRKVTSLEAMEDRRARERADRRNRVADRPWWFSSVQRPSIDPNDPLTDSLLPVTADRGDAATQSTSSNSWFFLGRPRRNQRENQNVREDASVDFASIQGDWASRTEEDPFWWSREDDSTAPPTEEVSWTQDKKSPAAGNR